MTTEVVDGEAIPVAVIDPNIVNSNRFRRLKRGDYGWSCSAVVLLSLPVLVQSIHDPNTDDDHEPYRYCRWIRDCSGTLNTDLACAVVSEHRCSIKNREGLKREGSLFDQFRTTHMNM